MTAKAATISKSAPSSTFKVPGASALSGVTTAINDATNPVATITQAGTSVVGGAATIEQGVSDTVGFTAELAKLGEDPSATLIRVLFILVGLALVVIGVAKLMGSSPTEVLSGASQGSSNSGGNATQATERVTSPPKSTPVKTAAEDTAKTAGTVAVVAA